MDEEKDKSGRKLEISAADADRLLACADGRSALLYLHILRSGAFSLTKAARELRMAEADVLQAAENLRRLGILPEGRPLPPAEELPEYGAGEIAARTKADPAFEGVVFEAQQALGRMLGANDLRILFGIYDHLGLPAEVILLLINHCIEVYRAANGEGRMPTMRYIEKEAFFWTNMEITTLEAAEEHIRREKERVSLTGRVKEALQIRGRGLTATEQNYVDSWLDMGFPPESLALAYDRTVVGTGKLTWKYMDSIVRSWNEKKLYTPAEIERGDARYVKKPAAPAPAGKAGDVENMRRMYERMKKGK